MKTFKLIVVLIFSFLSFNTAIAQDYKPVEVDLGVRYDILTGDFSGGGLGFFLEPHYNINNNFTVGLRLGFDFLGGTIDDGSDLEVSTSLLSSYILTGDYFFANKGNTRVFAGVGVGISSQGNLQIEDPNTGVSGEVALGSVFGVVPRVGVKLGILKVAVDYSIYTKEGSKNFLGINLGLGFGGKRK